MGLFRSAPSCALVGEELFTVAEALEHSIKVLSKKPRPTAADSSALARRASVLQRLRRSMNK